MPPLTTIMPPSDDTKFTWDRDPSPHPPHAITVPPPAPDYYPTSPILSHRSSDRPYHHNRSQSEWTNTVTLQSFTKDLEQGKQPSPPPASRFHERFTKYFFDLRMPAQRESQQRPPQWVPMREVPLQEWPPLEIEKRRRCECCRENNDRRRRMMALGVALIVFLLFLFGNIIFLNVRVMRLSSPTSAPPPATPTGSTNISNGLSEDAQQCLSQYTLNAPSDPRGYPCSTCLSVLQKVPSAFFENNQADGQQVRNAIQFCGLRSIFETTSGDGQRGLSNAGWAQDVRFCAWQGVRCDGFGRVSSM